MGHVCRRRRPCSSVLADADGLDEIVAQHGITPDERHHTFIPADCRGDLPLADQQFDLFISLYAGFISKPCGRYLRPRGWLLVNPSHGDAARVSIDQRFRLCAAVDPDSSGRDTISEELGVHLEPRRSAEVTRAKLHRSGRAVPSVETAFAYLFERV